MANSDLRLALFPVLFLTLLVVDSLRLMVPGFCCYPIMYLRCKCLHDSKILACYTYIVKDNNRRADQDDYRGWVEMSVCVVRCGALQEHQSVED